MPNVTVISGAPTGASFVYDGITFYAWGFTVEINGEVYVVTEWFDTNNPADEPNLVPDVIEDIENGSVDPGGISENDSPDNGPDDDGDDDGALASNSGSDYGDSV